MAGTDATRRGVTGGPVVVLVRPQLGENIGAAARAMLNCGLTDLRLVRPRDGWPSDKAVAAASGADEVLDNATLHATAAEAVADCRRVYATTARRRGLVKEILAPETAAARMRAEIAAGERVALLFGPESRGLDNDDVTLADAIVEAPLNPAFSSLNLAQAVLLVGYAWFRAGGEAPARALPMGATRPATKEELLGFFEHLESELDQCGFLQNVEKRPTMVRNIRAMFQRAGLTEQEVRTLRGIVSGLTIYNRRRAEVGPAGGAAPAEGDKHD